MSRTFWFLAGAAASTFVAVKGRQYYRRLTPAGMAEQIERAAQTSQARATDWLTDFATTYTQARQAKRSELMALLTQDERRPLT